MTAVAGHCELILEHADPGSECEKRLHQILMIVYTIAKRINGHECRMTTPVAQNTADLDTLLSSIQNSTQPSLSTIPTTSKPAKAG